MVAPSQRPTGTVLNINQLLDSSLMVLDWFSSTLEQHLDMTNVTGNTLFFQVAQCAIDAQPIHPHLESCPGPFSILNIFHFIVQPCLCFARLPHISFCNKHIFHHVLKINICIKLLYKNTSKTQHIRHTYSHATATPTHVDDNINK